MAPKPDADRKSSHATPPTSKAHCVSVLKSLRRTAVESDPLPQGDDLELLHVVCPETSASLRRATRRVRAAVSAAAACYVPAATDAESESSDGAPGAAADALFDRVREATDEALEQFNAALDRARGIQDAEPLETGPIGPETRLGSGRRRECAWVEMEKPQMAFPDWPVDNSDTPFVPPGVAGAKGADVDLYLQELYQANSKASGGGTEGKHPYEGEIRTAAEEMATRVFKKEDTVVYRSMESTPCTFIRTEEELFEVADRLKRVGEVAIDIENHSVRSFQGFTCLIQMSTRREDVVVDALALRGSVHRALAPIFADESIVKVLHGADKDVQWLERDFGVFVVNMFDTGQAARLLKFPSAALSYLQARFCDVTGTSKKKFQLSDWRQRPLPDDMFQYARSDTHYLLYIYDRLRTELADKELTAKAWKRSAVVARKRHTKIRYDAGIPRHLCAKYGLGFDAHQIRLLEELYGWRDRKGREEDESLNYVAPLGSLFGIVRARDKVRTVEGLMKYGFPSKSVPPMIKANADEIVRLIVDSLDAKLGDLEKKCTARPAPIQPCGAGDRTKEVSEGVEMHQKEAEEGLPSGGSLPLRSKTTTSTEQPQVTLKASALPKSRLYDSDSDSSDSDIDAESVSLVEVGVLNPVPGGKGSTGGLSLSSLTKPDAFASSPRELPGRAESDPNPRTLVENAKPICTATMAEKPVFNLSDSDDGDDNSDELPVKSVSELDAALDSKKAKATTAEKQASYITQETGASSKRDEGPSILAARKSVFNLSDDDSDDEEERLPLGAAAHNLVPKDILEQIHSGMNGFMPKSSDGFRVETASASDEELTPEPIMNNRPVATKRKRDNEDKLDQRPFTSLEERFGSSCVKKKRKNSKKKKKRVAMPEAAPVIPAFNYTKALQEEKKKRKEAKTDEPYDAMQKLRLDWKPDGKGKKRPRKARKHPASGSRSMSFSRR